MRIPAHDILHGAYVLAAAAHCFPAGTVHLAVVDPEVGTSRLPLAIAADRFASRPLSHTFHGRDLFAPVAAALAEGLPINVVGAPVGAPTEWPEFAPERSPGLLRGQVLYRDSFGNLITNIPGPWLGDLTDRLTLEYGGRRAIARRVRTYGDGAAWTVVVLEGSSGTVEIAVPSGSAAARLGLGAGERIALKVWRSGRA